MSLREALLWPLTLAYGTVVRVRAQAYNRGIFRQHRLDGFVISVGNLTVGGTGKTPMVLWIAQRLLREGKNVGILTRGFRGRPTSAKNEQPGSVPQDSTSDEVRMLRARLGDGVAFGIGADRFAQGLKLAARGVKWFVLDDGFQHRRLARGVDIVLIDASNPFGGGRLLPAGRLREPRSALARADIIVITRSDRAPAIEAAVRYDSDAPVFYAKPQLDCFHLAETDSAADNAVLRTKKLFAFCGIGNPPAFLACLREWGYEVTGRMFFPDHHCYTQRDAILIETDAHRVAAEALICTEKDFFNLSGVRWEALPVFYCRISMRIDREEEFWRAIMNRVQSPRKI